MDQRGPISVQVSVRSSPSSGGCFPVAPRRLGELGGEPGQGSPEDRNQSEEEGTCCCSPVRGHSKENTCRAWHASLENCSPAISWKSPGGEGGWENCRGWRTRGGCPGGSLRLQRARGQGDLCEGDLMQSISFFPQRSTCKGTLTFREFVQRGLSRGERGLLSGCNEKPWPHQWVFP